jgi:predicted nucleotidyltransferase
MARAEKSVRRSGVATGYITRNPYSQGGPVLKEITLHATIAEKREDLAALCRRFGVTRLDLFGSAARGTDSAASDVDFLVAFGAQKNDLDGFLDFKEALEALLARRVDLVDRTAVEASRNHIRRRHLLTGAQAVYAT